MAKLTAEQVSQLANNFLILAQSIGDYRMTNFDSLSKAQKSKIKDLHWEVLRYADNLFTVSATLVLEDVQTSLETISQVTKEIKETYDKLGNVQNAINVARSIVKLGGAFVSSNPQAIVSSISDLSKTWKKVSA